MVAVVQLVEHQVVILGVAGSSPVSYPSRPEGFLTLWPFAIWRYRRSGTGPTLTCVTEPQDEQLVAVGNKLFGSPTDVPPVFLSLLIKRGAGAARHIAAFADYPKGEFRVYWLDGQLLRGVTYRGKAEEASADEFAYGLSTLSDVKATYEFAHDDTHHTGWTRTVTIQFTDAEPIVIDNVEEGSDRSRLVKAILDAWAGGS